MDFGDGHSVNKFPQIQFRPKLIVDSKIVVRVMKTVGIDCGNEYTKAVVVEERKILGKAKIPTDFDINLAAETACAHALAQAKVEKADKIAVTGAGREAVEFADQVVNEVMAAAKGIYVLDSTIELVIDLGAEGYRAISLKENGGVGHYEANDRCAAGSGTFVETMARTLQVDIDEMSERALRHTEDITIASQCVVFAESEVVSLIHENQSVENIAYGVIAGVAKQVATVVKREGIKNNMVLIGGLGTSEVMLQCLSKELATTIESPENSQYVAAFGAAMSATYK